MVKKLLKICIIMAVLLIAAAPPALAQTKDESRYLMLVNNQHQLAADDAPQDLVALADYLPAGKSVYMTRGAAQAAGRMYAAMKEAGFGDLYGQSGYRDYALQQLLSQRKYNYYRAQGLGEAAAQQQANTVVALPGCSEHQSGMAIDFTTRVNGSSLTNSFGDTPSGRWLAANSWRYGFILRYGSGKEEITGYIYEPWHFRYVGEPHAEYMYENSLCLEEYYDLLQQQRLLLLRGDNGVTYTVYFSPDDDADTPGGQATVISRAFADTTTGMVFTSRMPKQDYLDIVAGWASDYHAVRVPAQLAGLPDCARPGDTGSEAAGCGMGDGGQMTAYLQQALMSAESYCLSGPDSLFFFRPLLAAGMERPPHPRQSSESLPDAEAGG